jgi:hypothetical protein
MTSQTAARWLKMLLPDIDWASRGIVSATAAIGVQASGFSSVVPWNPAGATPTTMNG